MRTELLETLRRVFSLPFSGECLNIGLYCALVQVTAYKLMGSLESAIRASNAQFDKADVLDRLRLKMLPHTGGEARAAPAPGGSPRRGRRRVAAAPFGACLGSSALLSDARVGGRGCAWVADWVGRVHPGVHHDGAADDRVHSGRDGALSASPPFSASQPPPWRPLFQRRSLQTSSISWPRSEMTCTACFPSPPCRSRATSGSSASSGG